jgi:site-specific recombinase XerD
VPHFAVDVSLCSGLPAPADPGARPARAPARKQLPSIPTHAQVAALIAAATNSRDRLLMQTLLLTGVRVSELTHLDVSDVAFVDRRIMVRHGKGDRDRTVPIPDQLLEPLRAWIGQSELGPLFPSPRGGRLSTRAVQKLFKRLARRAGLAEADKPRKYTPHKARHRYATDVLNKGANIRVVQRLLGHASVATTEIYTHFVDRDLDQAVRDL